MAQSAPLQVSAELYAEHPVARQAGLKIPKARRVDNDRAHIGLVGQVVDRHEGLNAVRSHVKALVDFKVHRGVATRIGIVGGGRGVAVIAP